MGACCRSISGIPGFPTRFIGNFPASTTPTASSSPAPMRPPATTRSATRSSLADPPCRRTPPLPAPRSCRKLPPRRRPRQRPRRPPRRKRRLPPPRRKRRRLLLSRRHRRCRTHRWWSFRICPGIHLPGHKSPRIRIASKHPHPLNRRMGVLRIFCR